MALEMRAAAAPRLGSPAAPDGGAGRVGDGSADRFTGGLLDPSAGSETAPIPGQIGPKMSDLVPHTGFQEKRLMRISRVHPTPPRDA